MHKNNKIINKTIAIILIQCFLLMDIAWAGGNSLVDLNKRNQLSNLAPKSYINFSQFQTAFNLQLNRLISKQNISDLSAALKNPQVIKTNTATNNLRIKLEQLINFFSLSIVLQFFINQINQKITAFIDNQVQKTAGVSSSYLGDNNQNNINIELKRIFEDMSAGDYYFVQGIKEEEVSSVEGHVGNLFERLHYLEWDEID
ncbi:MAG: hypothetical protein ABIG64_07745, partial [Candidatus Omnitrophota bacterium]